MFLIDIFPHMTDLLKKRKYINSINSSHVEAVSLLELTDEVIPGRQHELAEKYSQYPGK